MSRDAPERAPSCWHEQDARASRPAASRHSSVRERVTELAARQLAARSWESWQLASAYLCHAGAVAVLGDGRSYNVQAHAVLAERLSHSRVLQLHLGLRSPSMCAE